MTVRASIPAFHIPEELNAAAPPERRGIRRDHVKMMVLDRRTGSVAHGLFYQLDDYLRPGDLLVLNASRTIPAVLRGTWSRSGSVLGEDIEIRLASRIDDRTWQALVVSTGIRPLQGDRFAFAGPLAASVTEVVSKSMAILTFSLEGTLLTNQLYALAEPIRYEYISHPWALDYYQTVYASTPGSVEMPSAGRAFSWELLFKLQRRGVGIAYVQLHTGLSYLLDGDGFPDPRRNFESYEVPPDTAEAIMRTKADGGRVIAVGTTVVRALESAADGSGRLASGTGRTNLMIEATTPLRIADGLISGFHEPEASHLELLAAFIDPALLSDAYREAIEYGYLWHEFGDMNVIL
ncbi:S-adenosylmethionine:tRNA ribosyltransferase-isomerase [Paenibacillus lycopersici]|uniref:S-adenosylmethionine:tRNA ribosyltransferase-isomerase n=1 Tax=Paenibacillus lycopersici TaxID=2704462 RepID=A0A6C0G0P0_9BACL|nr:S-adenosylmethionine:tRNA ribosyltransferase-isomerase [Paenibacillus lycopersici]QHT60954.1 S-adenosylmethionine:tRNA ribosyltransferase-isomerase [Paenibacillus lycopersici]